MLLKPRQVPAMNQTQTWSKFGFDSKWFKTQTSETQAGCITSFPVGLGSLSCRKEFLASGTLIWHTWNPRVNIQACPQMVIEFPRCMNKKKGWHSESPRCLIHVSHQPVSPGGLFSRFNGERKEKLSTCRIWNKPDLHSWREAFMQINFPFAWV